MPVILVPSIPLGSTDVPASVLTYGNQQTVTSPNGKELWWIDGGDRTKIRKLDLDTGALLATYTAAGENFYWLYTVHGTTSTTGLVVAYSDRAPGTDNIFVFDHTGAFNYSTETTQKDLAPPTHVKVDTDLSNTDPNKSWKHNQLYFIRDGNRLGGDQNIYHINIKDMTDSSGTFALSGTLELTKTTTSKSWKKIRAARIYGRGDETPGVRWYADAIWVQDTAGQLYVVTVTGSSAANNTICHVQLPTEVTTGLSDYVVMDNFDSSHLPDSGGGASIYLLDDTEDVICCDIGGYWDVDWVGVTGTADPQSTSPNGVVLGGNFLSEIDGAMVGTTIRSPRSGIAAGYPRPPTAATKGILPEIAWDAFDQTSTFNLADKHVMLVLYGGPTTWTKIGRWGGVVPGLTPPALDGSYSNADNDIGIPYAEDGATADLDLPTYSPLAVVWGQRTTDSKPLYFTLIQDSATPTYRVQPMFAVYDEPDIEVRTMAGALIPNNVNQQCAVDFGTTTVGQTVQIYLQIINTGDADLDLTGSPVVAITGTNATDFSMNTSIVPTDPLPGGEGTAFLLEFTPTSSGGKKAIATITSDDPDEASYVFTLCGNVETFAYLGGGNPRVDINISADCNTITVDDVSDYGQTAGNRRTDLAVALFATKNTSSGNAAVTIDNTAPDTVTQWTITANGDGWYEFFIYVVPQYVGADAYQTDDIVSDSNLFYKSLIDSNTGNTPASSPAQWELLPEATLDIADFQAADNALEGPRDSFNRPDVLISCSANGTLENMLNRALACNPDCCCDNCEVKCKYKFMRGYIDVANWYMERGEFTKAQSIMEEFALQVPGLDKDCECS